MQAQNDVLLNISDALMKKTRLLSTFRDLPKLLSSVFTGSCFLDPTADSRSRDTDTEKHYNPSPSSSQKHLDSDNMQGFSAYSCLEGLKIWTHKDAIKPTCIDKTG